MMRQRGGAKTSRAPMTEEQKRQKRPVSHAMVMVHPISGRKILYFDPGYTVSINGTDKQERDELLEFLFQHQLQPQFQYAHRWAEGDLLIWDNLQTLHNAEADYRADEHRLIKRCQAMADQVFEPKFRHLAQMYGETRTLPSACANDRNAPALQTFREAARAADLTDLYVADG